ncbi:MAG: hypothetical protein IPP47_09800, partial [Bryobacterales bacterium]|nr:hypothetical protein [Bryobacterales bacterium]
ISEGLLMYLPEAVVAALAGATGEHWHWLTDITSAAMARATGLSSSDPIEKVRSAGHLAGERILGLLRDRGWRVRQHRSFLAPDGGRGQ